MTDAEAMKLHPESYPILHVYPRTMDIRDRIGYNGLEKRLITAEAFAKLPEYSCSIPTGVYIGKAWKRDEWAYARKKNANAKNYVIGRYEGILGDNVNVAIKWYDVEII